MGMEKEMEATVQGLGFKEVSTLLGLNSGKSRQVEGLGMGPFK